MLALDIFVPPSLWFRRYLWALHIRTSSVGCVWFVSGDDDDIVGGIKVGV